MKIGGEKRKRPLIFLCLGRLVTMAAALLGDVQMSWVGDLMARSWTTLRTGKARR